MFTIDVHIYSNDARFTPDGLDEWTLRVSPLASNPPLHSLIWALIKIHAMLGVHAWYGIRSDEYLNYG